MTSHFFLDKNIIVTTQFFSWSLPLTMTEKRKAIRISVRPITLKQQLQQQQTPIEVIVTIPGPFYIKETGSHLNSRKKGQLDNAT